MFEVLNEILPNDSSLYKSIYEAKKTMKVLGLDYERIHACPNDCIFYKNEYELANLSECPSCRAFRRQRRKDGSTKFKNGVPEIVLWYFPLIHRLKRSQETSKNLTWHENKRIRDGKLRIRDGKLRHPTDSVAWHLLSVRNCIFIKEKIVILHFKFH